MIILAGALASVLCALPKWFGPGIAGCIVAIVMPPLIVVRFKTPGFLIGVLIAWTSLSLGGQFQWSRDDLYTVGSTIGTELVGTWSGALVAAFVYLAPIYLARALWDYSRLRARLERVRIQFRHENQSE